MGGLEPATADEVQVLIQDAATGCADLDTLAKAKALVSGMPAVRGIFGQLGATHARQRERYQEC